MAFWRYRLYASSFRGECMLIYEHDGFLEVEAQEIKQLCRSIGAVTFGDAERDPFELHAVLCASLDNAEPRCRVAFYAKSLKRALVFAVKSSEPQASWQHGQEVLAQLGFQLDDVNLKLSPAMLDVVLRDVPGMANPAEALKQRQEKNQLLADLQKALDAGADSAQGKKAALKLSAEKRLGVRAQELRQLLETLLVPAEAAAADLKALASQVSDLNARLETAEALAKAERSRRELSESITAAAEKRIQELEEVLVDVETKSAQLVKEKRKVVKLQGQVKELSGELAAAEKAMAKERATQEQTLAEVKAAQERTAGLEVNLLEAEKAQAEALAQLAAEQTTKADLEQNLAEAEVRTATLRQELVQVTEKAVLNERALAQSAEVETQLAETQRDLQAALQRNQRLEEDLASAGEQSQELTAKLRQAEQATLAKTREEEQASTLAEQYEGVASELAELREEHARECKLRKHLEKSAAADEKRIKTLQDALARAEEVSAARAVDGELSKEQVRQIGALRAEVQEQQQRVMQEKKSREEAETALREAHELIDSLEKMLRKTDQAGDGGFSVAPLPAQDNLKVLELEEKLKSVGAQLEEARTRQETLAMALATAERQVAEQKEPLPQRQEERKARRIPEPVVVAESVAAPRAKSTKPLPHELRPAPKKGALFHPDWDLQGLPCQSSQQVYKAWETAFNVQISLEGYPSQYCMAFLVVLCLEKQKRLYMLYRLKQAKHTLVCVPTKTPEDEAALQKTIKEGLNYLKMSGFEMAEMAVENIDSTLGSYFLED